MTESTAVGRIAAWLANRLGVLATWSSWARVGVWTLVWVLLLGAVLTPRLTTPGDRDLTPDNPPSAVEYLGPTSRQDFAGFLSAAPSQDTFNVAWVGGSEVKWNEISVPAAVAARFGSFNGQPVQHRAYTVIAPRPLDALRGLETAVADGANAIVISANPIWSADEWSMRSWTNLDVSQPATGLQNGLWQWTLALTSPADVAWWAARQISSLVEAQFLYNEKLSPNLDRLDIIADPPADTTPPPPPTEEQLLLPADATDFWLVHQAGTEVFDSASIKRVAAMMRGMDADQPVAESFGRALLNIAATAKVPVFFYIPPFSPEALADPELSAALQQNYGFWNRIAADYKSPLVHIDLAQMTPQFADQAGFIDVVHMYDPHPFAEVLAPRLCEQWSNVYPGQGCQ